MVLSLLSCETFKISISDLYNITLDDLCGWYSLHVQTLKKVQQDKEEEFIAQEEILDNDNREFRSL